MLQVVVSSKKREAQDVCTFALVSADGQALPRFTAGSHVDVHLPQGLSRQYSLCNSPAENHRYLIGVLREPESRGGSSAMHDSVQEGDRLLISLPRNLFALDPGAGHSSSLLFAGGIGITPILSMAEQLATDGSSFHVHYCGRSRARMAFLERIQDAPFAERVSIHADDEPEHRLDIAATLAQAAKDAHIYVCGPAGFIDAVVEHAGKAGFGSEQVHVERFAASPMANSGDAGFALELARSGRTIQVGPEESVIQALARNGVEIETSCEQGICGTCMTGVLEGELDHRDMVLSAAEREANNVFLPCCSRAKGERLLIDL